MSRYTPIQLLDMTARVINAKNNREPEYHRFMAKLLPLAGINQAQCEFLIVELHRKNKAAVERQKHTAAQNIYDDILRAQQQADYGTQQQQSYAHFDFGKFR